MYGTIELDTPIYLIVYTMMGTWLNGTPVYKLTKVYACEFQDIDTLLAQHLCDGSSPIQWACFYREPDNPFKSTAVDIGNQSESPLTFEVKLPISGDTPWNALANVKLTPQAEQPIFPWDK